MHWSACAATSKHFKSQNLGLPKWSFYLLLSVLLFLHFCGLIPKTNAAFPKRKNQHCSVQVNSLCYDDELDGRPVKIIHDRQGLRVSGTRSRQPSQSNDQLLPKAGSEKNGFRLSSFFNAGRIFQTVAGQSPQIGSSSSSTPTVASYLLANPINGANRAQTLPDVMVSWLINSWNSLSDSVRNSLSQSLNETSPTRENTPTVNPTIYQQMAASSVQPSTYLPPLLNPSFASASLHPWPLAINTLLRYSIPSKPIITFHPVQSFQPAVEQELVDNYQVAPNPNQRRTNKETSILTREADKNNSANSFSSSEKHLLAQQPPKLLLSIDDQNPTNYTSIASFDSPANFSLENTKEHSHSFQMWNKINQPLEATVKESFSRQDTFKRLPPDSVSPQQTTVALDQTKPTHTFNISSTFPIKSDSWQPMNVANGANASVFSAKDDSFQPAQLFESKEANLLAKYPLHSPVELYTLSPISLSGHNLQVWDETDDKHDKKKGLTKLVKQLKETKKTFKKEKKKWKKNELEAFKIRKKIAIERYRANDQSQKAAAAKYAMRRITLDMVGLVGYQLANYLGPLNTKYWVRLPNADIVKDIKDFHPHMEQQLKKQIQNQYFSNEDPTFHNKISDNGSWKTGNVVWSESRPEKFYTNKKS